MKRTWKKIVLLVMSALWMFCVTASAEGASGDNSLYSLGLENASSCSPEFYYSTLEYNVTVPAGTKELYLSPITSDAYATILDISGTALDESGNGTVYITVEAPNGAQVSYVLNVTSEGGAVAETEAETEDAAAAEQARLEEEQRKAAESEEAARQEAERKANEEKLTKLTSENSQLTERMDVLLKVLYGLIAFAVILLFFIINQSLRNKDLKDDLKEARSQADMNNEFARKEQNMRTDYYYAPVNGRNQNPINAGNMQMADASSDMQAVFGNAPQRLQSQPMPGQAYAATQEAAPGRVPAAPVVPGNTAAGSVEAQTALDSVPTASEIPEAPQPQNLSRREQKKLEKAAKKAEKGNQPVVQPVPAPGQVQETLVQSTVEEPDVDVNMIDL